MIHPITLNPRGLSRTPAAECACIAEMVGTEASIEHRVSGAPVVWVRPKTYAEERHVLAMLAWQSNVLRWPRDGFVLRVARCSVAHRSQ